MTIKIAYPRTSLAAAAVLALAMAPAGGALAYDGAQQGGGAPQGGGGAPQGGGGAQQGGGAPAQQQAAPQQAEVDDQTIEKFVVAFTEVRDIQEEFAEELGSVEDNERAQELQAEAQEQMIDAVQNAGMEVQEYNQIASLMQNDPELRQRVIEKAE